MREKRLRAIALVISLLCASMWFGVIFLREKMVAFVGELPLAILFLMLFVIISLIEIKIEPNEEPIENVNISLNRNLQTTAIMLFLIINITGNESYSGSDYAIMTIGSVMFLLSEGWLIWCHKKKIIDMSRWEHKWGVPFMHLVNILSIIITLIAIFAPGP